MEIPEFVKFIIEKLEASGFEAFIVGGCVRDLLLGRVPQDWDITTNARPDDVCQIFPDSVYENIFGTVIVKKKNEVGETIETVEVTTYRSEQGFSDNRHPDEVRFEDSLDKDLERRDLTINAMAARPQGSAQALNDDLQKHIFAIDNLELIDLFGGRKDVQKKIIRAVGEPSERFREDALRMMRTIRFSCQLGFEIEEKTLRAVTKLAGNIKFIAKERIRDELEKILSSNRAYEGFVLLHRSKLLNYIIPEMLVGVGMKQNHHHTYTVFEHLMLSLRHCPSPKWQVRLASLLHDIGKPKSMREINGQRTFYNHEYIGAKMVERILTRLRFSADDTVMIVNLVRNHMFYYNVGEVTAASVRRLIAKTGKENLKDLIDIRIADRLGSSVKQARPYRLRHLEYMMEKVQNDPVSVKMLKINGTDLMNVLKIEPGPKIGAILEVLLSEVLDDPELNTIEFLEKRSVELNKLNLKELREKAKEVIEEKREEDDKEMKKEYYV